MTQNTFLFGRSNVIFKCYAVLWFATLFLSVASNYKAHQMASLFVGRIPRGTNEKELEEIFSKIGKLNRCEIKRDGSI
jgi:RNA recognition motif. (a.k.a. RRM, RBD, or RNP domain)